jgi:hypothetical protein
MLSVARSLVLGFLSVVSCAAICDPGSLAVSYAFPVIDGQCTLANIPAVFGDISTDFSLSINAKFYTRNPPGAFGTIIENGITGVIDGRLGMYVRDGKLVTKLVGTPWCSGSGCAFTEMNLNWLQTAAFPLNSFINIEVRRKQGVCSLLVDGATVVATNCTYQPLFPPPSNTNTWSIIGVGGQKTAAASCGAGSNLLSPSGVISSITLTGACTPCPTGTYASGG